MGPARLVAGRAVVVRRDPVVALLVGLNPRAEPQDAREHHGHHAHDQHEGGGHAFSDLAFFFAPFRAPGRGMASVGFTLKRSAMASAGGRGSRMRFSWSVPDFMSAILRPGVPRSP